MATIEIGNGVEVDTGEQVQVRKLPAPEALAAAAGPESVALAQALTEAGFVLAAEFELREKPGADLGILPTEPSVKVKVGPGESAVLLLESPDGVFAWGYAEALGGDVLAAGGGRTLKFSLASPRDQAFAFGGKGRGGLKGWLMDQLIKPVRTYVLKFLAGGTIDFLVKKIEGDNVSGLVSLAGDVKTWVPGAAIAKPATNKPILLMCHGTFSSTVGTYGQLAEHAAGQAFLARARSEYGAVLSYDHKTLAETPEQNAIDFLNALEVLGLAQDATIDAVSFSRGALVYRTLAEQLLVQSRPDIKLRKAVFVGCTNGGTQLAEPDNWEALADVYTNALLGGARLLTVLTGGASVNPLVVGGIKMLGRFVQTVAQLGITDRRVPGLAAMQPEGEVVKALNTSTADPSRLAEYYAITSDFVPKFQPRNGLSEVAQAALNKLTDDLIGPKNDLVVHTPGMTTFGTRQGQLKEVLDLGSTEDVYHTVYFAQDAVANRIAGWL